MLQAYIIAFWYQQTQKSKPISLGATFIPSYARELGLDPKTTLTAMTDELSVKQFRLVSYWSMIESNRGEYNFDELDWQINHAKKSGATISLAIGLRQPRWPECHPPKWVNINEPPSNWQPALEKYITAVIERYKNNTAIVSYQLENEFFNTFGSCPNRDRERLIGEYELVKKLDPSRPIILSRSNNYAGFAIGSPAADINGISLYRRTWNKEILRTYINYPFASWHYAYLAGMQKILKGQDSIIHELQAEPWPPRGQKIRNTPLEEQNRSFDAKQLTENVEFAKRTGIRHIDLWGAEYWYYRKVTLKDPSVWNEAIRTFK